MAITLQQFQTSDTNYISKLNSNNTIIQNAINALQAASGGSVSNPASLGLFFSGLFGGLTTLIGVDSYAPSTLSTTLTLQAGYAYRGPSQEVVYKAGTTAINFSGQGAGTYFIYVDSLGTPTRDTVSSSNDIFSVVWSGSSFGAITRVAEALYDASEEDDARRSTTLSQNFASLDERLEAIEAETQEVAESVGLVARYRKIGCSINGGGETITTGTKGFTQVDYNGTIVGWFISADQPGWIEVSVSLKRESPPAVPPAVPPTPDPISDLISAFAPIAITGSPYVDEAASAGTVEVATWDTDIQQWDTVQFTVDECFEITRATMYIRVLEILD